MEPYCDRVEFDGVPLVEYVVRALGKCFDQVRTKDLSLRVLLRELDSELASRCSITLAADLPWPR